MRILQFVDLAELFPGDNVLPVLELIKRKLTREQRMGLVIYLLRDMSPTDAANVLEKADPNYGRVEP